MCSRKTFLCKSCFSSYGTVNVKLEATILDVHYVPEKYTLIDSTIIKSVLIYMFNIIFYKTILGVRYMF